MTEVLQRANDAAVKRVQDYLALPLFETSVVAPYHYNYLGLELGSRIEDGTLRDALVRDLASGDLTGSASLGKGSPEELVQATTARLGREVAGLVSPERIRELMQLHGIGIDCSGFVYHVLAAALPGFEAQLSWPDQARQGVRRAGSAVFAVGEPVSDAWQPLDLLVLRDEQGTIDHVAILLLQEGRWHIAQSSRWTKTYGVSLVAVDEGSYAFSLEYGLDWDKRTSLGQLTRHRLAIT